MSPERADADRLAGNPILILSMIDAALPLPGMIVDMAVPMPIAFVPAISLILSAAAFADTHLKNRVPFSTVSPGRQAGQRPPRPPGGRFRAPLGPGAALDAPIEAVKPGDLAGSLAKCDCPGRRHLRTRNKNKR